MPPNYRYRLVAERLELVCVVGKYGTTEESGIHSLVPTIIELKIATFWA